MVEVVEVGPRDGLQNADVTLAPAERAELSLRLADAGLARVEAVSFVNPKWVPQMAGAEDVVAALPAREGVTWDGLVLNPKGLDRLLAAGMTHARYAIVVSDAFSRRNSNVSAEEGLANAVEVITRGREAGIGVGVVLATSFGCPFSGDVPVADVLAAAERAAQAGADELVFADTIGVGVPRQVREILGGAQGFGVRLGAHFHNTRNTGYANAFAAIETGATILDSSIGGLGGCPFAPNATGNVATEDLVWMLEREGVETGVDLGALIETTRWLHDGWPGLKLAGQQHRVDPYPGALAL